MRGLAVGGEGAGEGVISHDWRGFGVGQRSLGGGSAGSLSSDFGGFVGVFDLRGSSESSLDSSVCWSSTSGSCVSV